jgi:hypothetical protein
MPPLATGIDFGTCSARTVAETEGLPGLFRQVVPEHSFCP